jgi:hypothetical protein
MFKALLVCCVSFVASSYSFAKTFGEDFIMPRGGEYSLSRVFDEMKDKKKLKNVVVAAELSSVCQMKGCWVSLKTPASKVMTNTCDEAGLSAESQREMRVMFKDHKFSVPKDLTGDVIVMGTVKKKKLSKYQLKHLLKDGGCSKEQIEAVKGPIYKYQMEATGLKSTKAS